jgi:alginate O-acetyltransferase complex protein AlgJ
MNTTTLSNAAALPNQQAHNPSTKASHPIADAWAGGCFVVLLALGLLSNGLAWFDEQLTPTTAGWSSFMAGESMQQLAHDLAKAELPVKAAQIERGLSWQLSRDLGPRVREGELNWLFLNDELTPHVNAAQSAAKRAQQVMALQQRLAASGTQLLVVVVPDKSRIARAHLGTLHRPEAFTDRVKQWTDPLAQAGVEVLDLSAALATLQRQGEPVFLRTDSHWTEAGAEAAAALVAQRIQSLGAWRQVSPSASRVSLKDRVTTVRPGDLVKLAGLDGLPIGLQPRRELAQQSRFEVGRDATVAGAGQSSDAGNADLFGDAELPSIALIGTSFSRNSNFVPFLEQKMHRQVANFALDGGDFDGAARAYLRSAAFKQTPPKLLVWEIPERVLTADLNRHQLD